jgi:hypothetical protein
MPCSLFLQVLSSIMIYFLWNRWVGTIGGHKKLGQTSNLYKVKIQKYTLCKFGFLQIRL